VSSFIGSEVQTIDQETTENHQQHDAIVGNIDTEQEPYLSMLSNPVDHSYSNMQLSSSDEVPCLNHTNITSKSPAKREYC
jgi:hypothetical protein